MRKMCPKSLVAFAFNLCLFCGLMLVSTVGYSAKGDVKGKKGYVLKFNGFEFKAPNTTFSTIGLGYAYRGSFSVVEITPQQTTLQSILTYQRGNTTFIYPYKHVVQVPRFKTPEKGKF